MKFLNDFIIPFIGLKLGEHQFEYQISNTFFEHFEFNEFNSSTVKVELTLNKKPTFLELNFIISGSVNVFCDLSYEPYNQAINKSFNLIVKFGDEYNDNFEDILIIPHSDYEINVAQHIYEFIILSVPQKRIHPGVKDGTLKSKTIDKLNDLNSDKTQNRSKTIDPRWDSLKQLLTNKD